MKDMEEQNIDDLIVDYLNGNLDSSLKRELEQWIRLSAENEQYFAAMREIWYSTVSTVSDKYDKEAALSVFRRRVKVSMKKHSSKRRFCQYIAASVLLIAVSIISFYGGRGLMKHTVSDIVVEAPVGSRTKINLPDGTLVWLNAGSKLVYSQSFGVSERNVQLSGEGYFEVAKDEEHPFTVSTNDLSVSVFGTEFDFRDYPEDREVTVSLFRGKVLLKNLLRQETTKILQPSDFMVMDKREGLMVVHSNSANIDKSNLWKSGYIMFDEELLPDIINTLQLNYNVKIEVETEALLTDRYRGIFFKQEQTIGEVLGALSVASRGKLHYKIENDRVILY